MHRCRTTSTATMMPLTKTCSALSKHFYANESTFLRRCRTTSTATMMPLTKMWSVPSPSSALTHASRATGTISTSTCEWRSVCACVCVLCVCVCVPCMCMCVLLLQPTAPLLFYALMHTSCATGTISTAPVSGGEFVCVCVCVCVLLQGRLGDAYVCTLLERHDTYHAYGHT